MATKQEKTVTDIREACGLRLGEMIEAIIGDSRLKEIYTAQEKYPHDTDGLSAGETALKSGIISADTKTALLIAQAAERTLRLADKIDHFIENVEKLNQSIDDQAADAERKKEKEISAELKLQDKRTFLQKAFALYSAPGMTYAHRDAIKQVAQDAIAQAKKDLGYASLNQNKQFQFIGSDGDHDLLKAAQATHLVAQMYLNNEIDTYIKSDTFPEGLDAKHATNGLRREAAKFYSDAAMMMTKEGHFDAANAMRKVSNDIGKELAQTNAATPTQLLTQMLTDEQWVVDRLNQDLNMSFGHRFGFEPKQQEKLGGFMAQADQARKSLLEAAADNSVVTHKQTRTMKPIKLKNGG